MPLDSDDLPGDLPEDLHRRLRAELVAFVNACGPRRVMPTTFHVGVPGGRRGVDQVGAVEERGFDAALRTDLVERCLAWLDADVAAPLPWLTRSGALVPYDVDRAWSAAAREAFSRRGLDYPGFWVVTRGGWIDLDAAEITEQRVRRRR